MGSSKNTDEKINALMLSGGMGIFRAGKVLSIAGTKDKFIFLFAHESANAKPATKDNTFKVSLPAAAVDDMLRKLARLHEAARLDKANPEGSS